LNKETVGKEFEHHIREHELLLHKVCCIYAYNTTDRQDLFQEIVIQLWKAFPKFKGEAKISTWMYRIAINTAITGLRKKKDIIISFEPYTLPEHPVDETTALQKEEQLKELYNAIDKLNQVEKAIVMLYMEDRSYEEMEDILGINQGNLRVKINRIKDKLKQLTKNV
jgi:RNA polymerase sigma factor (sigma-70 family)